MSTTSTSCSLLASVAFHAQTVPAAGGRRQLASLRHTLAGLRPGQVVEAVFRDRRYGTFSILGTVTPTFFVAGLSLLRETATGTSDDDADPDRTCRVRQPAGNLFAVTVIANGLIDDTTPGPARLQPHKQGDLVQARIRQHPYGLFQLIGNCVALHREGMLWAGTWLLSVDGAVQPRLEQLVVVPPVTIGG